MFRRRAKKTLRIASALLAAAFVAPLHAAAAAPKVGAPQAILVEPATGEIVFARNANVERPIASTTKMMTALITLDKAKLSDTFTTAPYNALSVESTAGFKAGEHVKVSDLLRALLVASANDAAHTLAVRVGDGSAQKFVDLMNARARKLGLAHTHFANPIGLDSPGNYSTATDLVKLGLILRTNAFARATMDKAQVTITSGAHKRTLKNRDTLIGKVPFMNGIKTGHTNSAGYLLVGSASKSGVTLVSAVMGAGSEGARNSDTVALMRYGFKRYTVVPAVTANKVYATVKVSDQAQPVNLIAKASVKRVVRKGQTITTKAVVPAQLTGPLPAGSKGGDLNLLYRGRVVDRVPLYTTVPVAAPSAASGLADDLVGPGGIALIALAGGTILVVLLRRRAKKSDRRESSAESDARIA